jgi:BirA family transcriptional regulator, biotin operon repressor / biotin---[acetyl-CoA-carboxylase] ligase
MPAGPAPVRAFLGLGSNLGDRAARLHEAVRRLDAPDLRVTGQSPIYETAPWGRTGQPTFLNQVISVETPLSPRALLARCRLVEAALGRVRDADRESARWGPRAIDVDILLVGDAVVAEPDLVIPHAELTRRAFVLVPLADLAPGFRLPGGETVGAALAACRDRDAVWRWDDADGAGVVGREIRWYDTVPSTNDLARTLAHTGTAEGTVVVAERQTAGRGRLGRAWSSPGGGLWLSVILRPRLPVERWPTIGLAACTAVAEAIEATAALPARLKWPNDVLVGGRKVAGLLLESGLGEPAWLVAGVGVNVNVAPGDLPVRPSYPATSLAAARGGPVNRGELMRAFLRRFDGAYAALRRDGADAVLDRWRERSDTIGRTVRVAVGGPEAGAEAAVVEGIATGVDETGALLVLECSGRERRIIAGDVAGEVAVEGSR